MGPARVVERLISLDFPCGTIPSTVLEDVMQERHALLRAYGWPEGTHLALPADPAAPRKESESREEAPR